LPEPNVTPSPTLFFQTVNAFQQTEVMRAALQLDVFTAIAKGAQDAEAIATACKASARGMRVLCDYLVILGFVTKQNGMYSLTQDSAIFLDARSPAFIGSAIQFLLSPRRTEGFQHLAEAVRKGGTATPESSVDPENPMWVDFARSMAPVMKIPAESLATLLKEQGIRPRKVLSLAAGHGLFEIAIARQNPEAQVWAIDWANVLAVAQENAAAAGLADNYHVIPGSALDVDFGSGYDLALVINFISHFDVTTCENVLRKVYGSLNENGRAVVMAFVPNEDRVSPPMAAEFALSMLANTPAGDAYTYAEYQKMFSRAGFRSTEQQALPPTAFSVVTATK
jgi:2-polyprenyl-3-methyl-5-hydroxy-6-metoxy-1,4-benzoquinol methylase